jgi:AcrR family transcriptional regulator
MDADTTTSTPRRRSDGEQTHAAILEVAMRLASVEGLSGLTIGRLADESGISKSGLYAHFGSKERLQIETIDAAWEVFQREVIQPAMDAPDGIARLVALSDAYLGYVERKVFPGGCFFAGLLTEFDARSGQIHEIVAEGNREWVEFQVSLVARAQEMGEIDPAIDPEQLAFEAEALLEFAGYLFVLHHDAAHLERGRTAIHSLLERVAIDPAGLSRIRLRSR